MFQRTGRLAIRTFQARNALRPHAFSTQLNQSSALLQSLQWREARFYSTEEKTSEKTSEEQTENKEQEKQAEETPEQIQIRELTEELNKFKNAYATSLADQENTRRIARQDVKNATEYAVTKMAKSMLEVVDNLDRAIGSLKDEDLESFMKQIESESSEDMKKKATQIKSVVSGIKIIRKVMLKSLEANGVTQIADPINAKFDPEYHEAIMKQNVSEDKKDLVGQVAHVISTGYMIKDRILRPVRVVVYVDEEE